MMSADRTVAREYVTWLLREHAQDWYRVLGYLIEADLRQLLKALEEQGQDLHALQHETVMEIQVRIVPVDPANPRFPRAAQL